MSHYERLAKSGLCKQVLAGEQIECTGGASASERAMYLLVSGKVDVYDVGATDLTKPSYTVQPGGVFGGYEFFSGVERSYYMADKPCVVFPVSVDSFEKLAKAEPKILFEALKAAYLAAEEADTFYDLPDEQSSDEVSEESAPEHPPVYQAPSPAVEVLGSTLFPDGHKRYPNRKNPEYAKLVFQKAYSCPLCKKNFNDFRVLQSKLFETNPLRYDLRRYYSGFQTEWYDIVTCTHCFFSTIYSYFSEPRRLLPAQIEKELSIARESLAIDFSAERDIDYVFTTHYLALLCASGYARGGRELSAKVWGNLSWLYEDVEDEAMERYASSRAAKAYEAVYLESSGLTPVQDQIVCLKTAAFMYRSGEGDHSVIRKYLYNAVTNRSGSKVYANLAEDITEMLQIVDVK